LLHTTAGMAARCATGQSAFVSLSFKVSPCPVEVFALQVQAQASK